MEFIELLEHISPLSNECKKSLLQHVSEITFPKGTRIIEADKNSHYIYFIKKGIVRAFTETKQEELTFWIGKEGNPVISIQNYVANESSYETIETLEDCILYRINMELLQQKYHSDISLANWGRKFAEQELIRTEKRLIERLTQSATERYQNILTNEPELLQRVSLGIIASYLGISQVSLSRIRAEIK